MQAAGPDALSDAQRAAADAGHKAMMPVGADAGGRPFLDYAISALADCGCGEVCLVVAPDHAVIRAHYDRIPRSRVRIHYAVQAEASGTAQAVLAAAAFAGADAFLVVNGDNLYPVDALRAVVALDGPGLAAFDQASLVSESGFPEQRVGQFAVVGRDAGGWLTGIEEKPRLDDWTARGSDALISMNLWRFDERIFDACRDVPRSPRGEFELPAAVMLARDRGMRFRVVPAHGAVLDLSQRADVTARQRPAGRPWNRSCERTAVRSIWA